MEKIKLKNVEEFLYILIQYINIMYNVNIVYCNNKCCHVTHMTGIRQKTNYVFTAHKELYGEILAP